MHKKNLNPGDVLIEIAPGLPRTSLLVAPSNGGLRVLLVDPDPDRLEAVMRHLSGLEHTGQIVEFSTATSQHDARLCTTIFRYFAFASGFDTGEVQQDAVVINPFLPRYRCDGTQEPIDSPIWGLVAAAHANNLRIPFVLVVDEDEGRWDPFKGDPIYTEAGGFTASTPIGWKLAVERAIELADIGKSVWTVGDKTSTGPEVVEH